MKRAIGYIRVSHARPTEEKLSPEIQRQRIREYCKLKKWPLGDILEDIYSRGATFDRPGWEALEQYDNHDVIATRNYESDATGKG
ncbi:MAG: recombinase family protein [Actinobacteria bacterium]|nr:recombinase family protein [Actinomycetota bacterium]